MNIQELDGQKYKVLETQVLEFSDSHVLQITEDFGATFYTCEADTYSCYIGKENKVLKFCKNNRTMDISEMSSESYINYEDENGIVASIKKPWIPKITSRLEFTPIEFLPEPEEEYCGGDEI